MFLHIKQARYRNDYKVEVTFSDGRTGIADLAPALTGPVFEPLRDKGVFARFTVDADLQTIVWPNGADLAPEYIYFQAFRNDPELHEQFRTWGYLPGDDSKTNTRPEAVLRD